MVTVKLQEARRLLELSVDYDKRFARSGDRLALEPRRERAFDRSWTNFTPTGRATAQRGRRARPGAAISALATSEATVGNAAGSKWAALNAVVEWEDWYRPARGERFARAALDTSPVKAKAL